jgi:hypothetical protein
MTDDSYARPVHKLRSCWADSALQPSSVVVAWRSTAYPRVVKTLRLWRDLWIARRAWKVRLALWLAAVAVLAWYWLSRSGREPFWIYAAAIATPIVLNFVFWQSDQRTDREVRSRRAVLVRDDP